MFPGPPVLDLFGLAPLLERRNDLVIQSDSSLTGWGLKTARWPLQGVKECGRVQERTRFRLPEGRRAQRTRVSAGRSGLRARRADWPLDRQQPGGDAGGYQRLGGRSRLPGGAGGGLEGQPLAHRCLWAVALPGRGFDSRRALLRSRDAAHCEFGPRKRLAPTLPR